MRFSLLLSLDLRLYRFPVNLDLLVELFEAIVGFLLVILLKEAFTICNHRVNMSFLSYSNLQGLVPLVHLDIHLDSSVVQTS